MLLTPKIRNIPSRIVSLLEMLVLLSLGFLIYFFVIPEPPPLEENLRISPAPVDREEESDEPDGRKPEAPPPATVRDRYEFEGGEVFFDDAIEDAFAAMVGRATSSVATVTYTIGPGPAVTALEKAASRGVTVKVVAGRSAFERSPSFPFTELHPAKGLLHEKFLVVDGRTILLSSRNLSAGQSKNSAILFSDAPKLAAILSDEFAALEEMRVEKRCENGCPVEYGTIYFLPGKGCVNTKEALLTATGGIDLAMYTMTIGTPLMTGLKKNLKKGRTLRIILDDWAADDGPTVNARAANYLESMGAAVLFDRLNDTKGRPMNFHHKFAVVDDGAALVFGSMNWTKAGCYRNRELLFITRSGDIASIFKTYFDDILKAITPVTATRAEN